MNKMKVLLCSVPDGPVGASNVSGFFIPPVGIIQLVNWLDKKNYDAEIYDINNIRPTEEELRAAFKKIKPTVVGLSAPLTHCYPHVKFIAKMLRELFPNVWIIVGGHITNSANVLLDKTETDICVVGDGELPLIKLLDYFQLHSNSREFDYSYFSQIKGLAFNDANNKLKVTGYGEQLPASELEYTNFERISKLLYGEDKKKIIDNYFPPVKDNHIIKQSKYYEKNKNKRIASIETAKGCVARCTFCQRATKGYRPYATHDLEAHILHLKEKYNVAGVSMNDENFGSNKKQTYEIARIMKKCDVFWFAGGVRCTSVTYEDLKFYKEHNLIWMKFGIESGSQKMLDIMEKKFFTKDVLNAITNCTRAGVVTWPDAIMVGMPGETEETIKDSARFMGQLRYIVNLDWSQDEPPFWAMAIPGTPLYEYCQQTGLIGKTVDEEEDYLVRISEEKASFLNHLNTTNLSTKDLHSWNYIYKYEAKCSYLKLLIKDSKSIKEMLFKIYEKCIKGDLNNPIAKIPSFKKKYKFQSGLKFYTWVFAYVAVNIFFSLGTLLLPRALMIPIIKAYANLRYYSLWSRCKEKTGKQKYNIFNEQNVNLASNLRITDNRIAQTNRQIERSLRHFTMVNRKYMKPAATEEERGLEILVQGQ